MREELNFIESVPEFVIKELTSSSLWKPLRRMGGDKNEISHSFQTYVLKLPPVMNDKERRIIDLPMLFKNKIQGNCKMFDYKYSDIKGIKPDEMNNNPYLDFYSPVSLKTGELLPYNNRDRDKIGYTPKNRIEAIHNHCKFSITNDKYINFSGSLHEYKHRGTNFGDFTFQELFEVIQELYENFQINPFSDHLHNLEFGVNVILPFQTKTFLNSIIVFKGKEYERRSYKGRGYMIKFLFDQYELKIYDKGLQFSLSESVLRVEIKVTKMNFLRAKGVKLHTSADLLNPEVHSRLGEILRDYFNQLVVFDPTIILSKLKSREREILKDGYNPQYWMLLKESNPETFKKKLKRFKELVSIHGRLNLLETVSDLISKKWDFLTSQNPETFEKVSIYLTGIYRKTFPEITDLPKIHFPQNNPSNSVLYQVNNEPEVRRVCRSCGRDISNQKPGSYFCSERIFGKEGKKCRNRDSNPRNNFKKREDRILKMGVLFDIMPLLKIRPKTLKFRVH